MKMPVKHVCLIVFVVFLKSKVRSGETPTTECQGEEMAVQHLISYYTWLYRLSRYLLPGFFPKTLVCTMDEKQRRVLCAQVAKFCYFQHKDEVTTKEIVEETTARGECKRENFEFKRLDGDGYKTSTKKMFLCPLITKWGGQMSNVYISASNEINTVLVFQKNKDKIRLVHVVKNLNFETNDKPKKLLPVEIDNKLKKLTSTEKNDNTEKSISAPQADPQAAKGV